MTGDWPPPRDLLHSTPATPAEREVFDAELSEHERLEARIMWKMVASMAFVVVMVVIRDLWLT